LQVREFKEEVMAELSRDQVLAAVHPIDDATVAEIIATGITHDELVQACRLFDQERHLKAPHEVPRGRIGRVVAILESIETEVKESWLGEFGSKLE
jgi:hypothetical protein